MCRGSVGTTIPADITTGGGGTITTGGIGTAGKPILM